MLDGTFNTTYRVSRAYDIVGADGSAKNWTSKIDDQFVDGVTNDLVGNKEQLLADIEKSFTDDSYFTKNDIKVTIRIPTPPKISNDDFTGAVAVLDEFELLCNDVKYIVRVCATVCRGLNRSKLWIRLSQKDKKISIGDQERYEYRKYVENHIRAISKAFSFYYKKHLFSWLSKTNKDFEKEEKNLDIEPVFEMESFVVSVVNSPCIDNVKLYKSINDLNHHEITLHDVYEQYSKPFLFYPLEYKDSDAKWIVVDLKECISLFKKVYHNGKYTAVGENTKIDGLGHYGITFKDPKLESDNNIDVISSRSPLELYSHNL